MKLPPVHCACGALMRLTTAPAGMAYREGQSVYLCTAPGCSGRHGAHPDGRPLGIPGDGRTNAARVRAHSALDELWARGFLPGRKEAYLWLQSVLRLPEQEAHIARFSVETCELVIKLCALFREGRTMRSSPIVDVDPWGLVPPGVDPEGPIDFDADRRAELARAAHEADPFGDDAFCEAPIDGPASGLAPIVIAHRSSTTATEDPFCESPEGL